MLLGLSIPICPSCGFANSPRSTTRPSGPIWIRAFRQRFASIYRNLPDLGKTATFWFASPCSAARLLRDGSGDDLFFLFIIIGTTSRGAATGFAGIPIGLALTLIHLVSIPVTNTSVNPARSTGPALFAGGEYLGQLWLFWVAPILGAMIAGLLSRWLQEPQSGNA